jgi:hypothetical protein
MSKAAYNKQNVEIAKRTSNALNIAFSITAFIIVGWHGLQHKPWINYKRLSFENAYRIKVNRLVMSRGVYYLNDSLCLGSEDVRIKTPREKYLLYWLSVGDSIIKPGYSDTLILVSNGVTEPFLLDLTKHDREK